MKDKIVKKCFSGLILSLCFSFFVVNFCYGDAAGFKKYESYRNKEQEVAKSKGISYDIITPDNIIEEKQNELNKKIGKSVFDLKKFSKTTFIKKGNKEKSIIGESVIITDYDKNVSYYYNERLKNWVEYNENYTNINDQEDYTNINNKEQEAFLNMYKKYFSNSGFKDITFIGYEKKYGYKCAVFKVVLTDEDLKIALSKEYKSSMSKLKKTDKYLNLTYKDYKRYFVDECGIFICDVIDNVEFPTNVKNIRVGIDDSEVSLPKDAVVISADKAFVKLINTSENELDNTTINKTNLTVNDTKEQSGNIPTKKQDLKTQIKNDIKKEIKEEIKEEIKTETKRVAKEEAKKILSGFLGF